MATLSASGLGSNLDIEGIVTKLMSVERQPITALAKPTASYQAKLTAYGSVKSSLASLQTAVSGLTSTSRFNAFSANISDPGLLSATPSNTATTGNYSIEVKTLAQAQKISTDPLTAPFSSLNDVVGTGTLTLQFGTFSGGTFTANATKAAQTITIGPSNNTLSGVRDAINAANVGVTASVINDGGSYRLVIGSNDTGTANSLKISVSDGDGGNSDTSGLSILAYNPAGAAGSGKNMQQTLQPKDAALRVDGIDIVSSSNVVTNAIDGVTLNLTKTNDGVPATLAVKRDASGVRTAVDSFVKAYNNTAKTLKDFSGYNATTKQAGLLIGDATLGSVQSELRNILNTPIAGAGGGLNSLSDIGISFLKNGQLSLDFTQLDKVANDPTKDISTLFASVGKSSDSLVSFVSSASDTKPGSHALNVTQVATRSILTGTATSGTTVIGAGNNALDLTIDGVAASVTLSSGTYTPSSLAAELQSKINGAPSLSNGGIAVTVTAGTAGKLTGNTAVASKTIDSTLGNDQLDITLAGITHTITLTSKVYATDDDLAAELQTQINTAFAGDGKTVTATQSGGTLSLALNNSFGSVQNVSIADVAGNTGASNLFGGAPSFSGGSEMTLTSKKYGAASSVAITASAAATNLFGTANTGTVAVDVAGTIGGVAATGFGQSLTATSGDAKGLKVNVTGGSTGDRGTVKFALGYATQLDKALSRILDSEKGLITSRTDGINASMKRIDARKTALEARMTDIEARYRKQFSALDSLITKMNQTSSYLNQQIASLAALNKQ